jgi:hypothetical protein
MCLAAVAEAAIGAALQVQREPHQPQQKKSVFFCEICG